MYYSITFWKRYTNENVIELRGHHVNDAVLLKDKKFKKIGLENRKKYRLN